MLIWLEQSFIESTEKLNDRFSDQDRKELSQTIEANYEKLRLRARTTTTISKTCPLLADYNSYDLTSSIGSNGKKRIG